MPTLPEEMSALLLENNHGVLATSSQDVPHASLMAYTVQAQTQYILMATSASTRKWANLLANPKMALLVDDRAKQARSGASGEPPATRALTIGGTQRNVSDRAEQSEILEALRARHPHLSGLLAREDVRVIRLLPLWGLLLRGPEDAVFINF